MEITYLTGKEVAQLGPSYTQVYLATHKNGKRLPFMNRSFISFSFGEKKRADGEMVPVNIEDFDLIATISGDRLERDAYGSFEDLATVYDTILGLFYWNTYYHTNSITFNLATEHMTLRLLDDFKFWFRAGEVKELILSEHPNRAIMARVANPPQLKLLPFEESVNMAFETEHSFLHFKTSTTVYKGEIVLEFVMDEPFWYAKRNIIGELNENGIYIETWKDANWVDVVPASDSKDALKVIYEDHIPIGSDVKVNVFLGGDIFASVLYEDWSQIATPITAELYNAGHNNPEYSISKLNAFINKPEESYWYGASIAKDDSDLTHGLIAGHISATSGNLAEGISVAQGENSATYLYYAGTAPSPVELKFSLYPIFGEGGYIISPYNKYSLNLEVTTPYNTITLEATKKHVFLFTTPVLLTSYNLVIKILDEPSIFIAGNAWLVVRETIRDTIKHPIVRAWANRLIDKYDIEELGGIIAPINTLTQLPVYNLEDMKDDIKLGMKLLFCNNNNESFLLSFVFNGKTGTAIGTFTTRDPKQLSIKSVFDLNTDTLSNQIKSTETTIITIENVGDMVKSSYLILDERNVLDENFLVQAWSENTPEYSYKITHDYTDSLRDLHFKFKNMYL